MKRLTLVALLAVAATEANARGGSCSSGLCTATAAIVLCLLVLAFVASLFDSVRKHGLIKGVLANRAAQFVFGYVGILIVAVGGSVAALKLWGNPGVYWYLGSVAATVLITNYFSRPSSRAPKSARNSSDATL